MMESFARRYDAWVLGRPLAGAIGFGTGAGVFCLASA